MCGIWTSDDSSRVFVGLENGDGAMIGPVRNFGVAAGTQPAPGAAHLSVVEGTAAPTAGGTVLSD